MIPQKSVQFLCQLNIYITNNKRPIENSDMLIYFTDRLKDAGGVVQVVQWEAPSSNLSTD
jgi:hypothetical protein